MLPPVTARPFTGGALLLALDFEARDAAADGGPEVDLDLVLEVGPGLRTARLSAASVEHAGEDVAEAGTKAVALEACEDLPPPWKPEKSKPSKSMGAPC